MRPLPSQYDVTVDVTAVHVVSPGWLARAAESMYATREAYRRQLRLAQSGYLTNQARERALAGRR